MVKKIVVNVPLTRGNNKSCILKTVAKLEGIKSMNIDEEKGTLTVVGSVDPVCIIKSLRKKKLCALIDSVGEDKQEEKKEEKQEDDKKKECEELCKKMTECYGYGRPVPSLPYSNIVCYEEPHNGCVIM